MRYNTRDYLSIQYEVKSMYTASDLKKGLKIMFEDQPWIITDFDFSKPGKGQAIYNCKLRNMLNGSGKSCSFRSNDRFEKPDLAQLPLVYSYEDNGTYIFNDADYNEIRVDKEILGDKVYFLTDGLEVDALLYNDAVIDMDLPSFIERKVIKCDPGVRGNTAAGKVTKPGQVEGGYELPVPLFINEGDIIRIDTRTGEYADRVKS
jgi:elongation factor P